MVKALWVGQGGEKWGTGRSLSWQTAQLCCGEKSFPKNAMCWNANTEQVMGLTAGTDEMQWKHLQKQCWSYSPSTECSSSSSNTVPVGLLSCIVPIYSNLFYFYASFPATLLRAQRYPRVWLLFLNHLTRAANWSQHRLIDLRRGDFFHHGKASADHIAFNQITLII